MLGLVEIAKNYYNEPEKLQRYLKGIRISGEYLMTLLDHMMKAACSDKEEGNGCDYLPLSQEELERYLKEKISSGQENNAVYDFSGKRILIAEDVAINREIAAEILHQTGAETEFAENGRICLEMVEAAPAGGYDLILMDLMMPEMDGLEAARRIRALPDREKASVPIIALTTNVDEKDRKAAFEAGMDAFTEKPIFVDRLFGTMGKYLHREVSK